MMETLLKTRRTWREGRKTVEVFKTNVQDDISADLVVNQLKKIIPDGRINFDLEDCDKILRIEALKQDIDLFSIIHCVRELGFWIETLE